MTVYNIIHKILMSGNQIKNIKIILNHHNKFIWRTLQVQC